MPSCVFLLAGFRFLLATSWLIQECVDALTRLQHPLRRFGVNEPVIAPDLDQCRRWQP